MGIPSQAAGRRLLVENISSENLILFSGVQINPGECLDMFVEDPAITEARALDDMVNPLGSLYIETSVNNRVRVVDFDVTGTVSVPLVVRGNLDKIVFSRVKEEVVSSSFSASIGDPAYQNVGYSPGQIFYVRVTGDDDTGDGLTLSSAFRQPQKALDQIPDLARGYFEIDCGPGDFEAPVFRRLVPATQYDLIIEVFGDRGSPDITVGSPQTWVEQNKGRWQTGVGAYGATIDDDSHWIEMPNSTGFLSESRVAANSTTPNLDAPMTGDAGQSVTAVHPFATTFSDPTTTASFVIGELGSVHRSGPGILEVPLAYTGIEFTPSFANRFENCLLRGCKLTTILTQMSGVGAYVVTTGFRVIGRVSVFNSILKGNMDVVAAMGFSGIQRSGVINVSPGFGAVGGTPFLSINDASLEGAGVSLDRATMSLDGPVECIAATKFVSAVHGSAIISPFVYAVTGTCSAIPVVLSTHSHAHEIVGNYTITNTGTAGEEITVGGNTVGTFAGADKNDLALGLSSQLCSYD